MYKTFNCVTCCDEAVSDSFGKDCKFVGDSARPRGGALALRKTNDAIKSESPKRRTTKVSNRQREDRPSTREERGEEETQPVRGEGGYVRGIMDWNPLGSCEVKRRSFPKSGRQTFLALPGAVVHKNAAVPNTSLASSRCHSEVPICGPRDHHCQAKGRYAGPYLRHTANSRPSPERRGRGE